MTANPNPDRITNPMWQLWLGAQAAIPGVKLGGIYASTKGYHNTRRWLLANLPGNYSIQLPLDRQGPDDKGAAIDLTMSGDQMKLRTGYLKRAAFHPDDNRLAAVRDFYGTLDGSTVYGLIHDGPGTGWRGSTSDDTHLWHIHISIIRAFVTDWSRLAPILSVLSGETWEQWLSGGDEVSAAEVWGYKIPNKSHSTTMTTGGALSNIEDEQDQMHARQITMDAKLDALLSASGEEVKRDAEVRAELAALSSLMSGVRTLVEQGQSGELDAAEVVRLIGEKLTAAATPS